MASGTFFLNLDGYIKSLRYVRLNFPNVTRIVSSERHGPMRRSLPEIYLARGRRRRRSDQRERESSSTRGVSIIHENFIFSIENYHYYYYYVQALGAHEIPAVVAETDDDDDDDNNNNNNNEMREHLDDNGFAIGRGTPIQDFYAGQSIFITGN